MLTAIRTAVLYFHLTLESSNRKTGKIPVSTSSKLTCPKHCPLKKFGCYADGGPLAIHWELVTRGERGYSLDEFCDRVRRLPDGQLWRHDEAGDLPGDAENDLLDADAVNQIVEANQGKRGFTYCHYPPSKGNNAEIIWLANQGGFTVNLSADNLAEADDFVRLGIAPVTVIVKHNQEGNLRTPDGNLVVLCPFDTHGVQCIDCGLCAWKDRKCIIGFRAHGSQKAKAELVTIQSASA